METDLKGTIIIDYRQGENPLEDVEFKVYHIATLEEEEYSLLPSYEWAKIDFDQLTNNAYLIEINTYLENEIAYGMIEPDMIFLTDESGNYKLDDLDLGLYFIQSEMVEIDAEQIYSEPFLITIGAYDGERYVYSYTAEPKVMTLSVEDEDLTTEDIVQESTQETVSGTVQAVESLPQTGTNANVISLYAAGVIFLLVGILLGGRKRRKDEED
ncbi:MAG: LPXTG cell wall anchor domain-containing protein [Eubacteriales bacterium]